MIKLPTIGGGERERRRRKTRLNTEHREIQEKAKRHEGEEEEIKKSAAEAAAACLKKLRCYTIVYHNKPKQPLLHQTGSVKRARENATTIERE